MSGETAEARRTNAERVRDALEALPATIPEIRRLEVGLDLRDRPGNWDLVLTVDVEDREALEAYRAHPDHVVVADLIGSLERTRMCVDHEV
jgi:hypothetical protein